MHHFPGAVRGLLIAATALVAAAAGGSPQGVGYVADGSAPLVSITREHGRVRGLADAPLVRVYGDGRVLVHVPAFMRGAGRYEYRLERGELDTLIADLDTAGLMRFDQSRAATRRNAAAAAQRAATGERFATLDATVTHIALRFSSFRHGDGAAAALARDIRWADAAIESLRYPQLDDLAGLAAAEKRLLGLMDDPRRRPLTNSEVK